MRCAYPVVIEEGPDGVTVTSEDVPEMVTEGRSRAEAMDRAADAMVTALSIYVDDGRKLPTPSAANGRPVVAVSQIEAAKLALHAAMTANGITDAALARRLGMDAASVRRLRDPLEPGQMEALAAALRSRGGELPAATES